LGGAPRSGPVKQYIDPDKFVAEAKPVTFEEYKPTHEFADFAIDERIKRNVADKGYKIPTPIQDQTIPLMLEGKDVVGIAATGTGKTGAFAIPMLHSLLKAKEGRALILAPTRELAQQIAEETESFAKGCNVRVALLIGGASMNLQVRDLRANPQVVIGTPGRVRDHIRHGTLKLSTVSILVLDEVDRMLDMGFIADISSILANVPKERQSLFFSATVDTKVESLIRGFSRDPETVSTRTTSENVATANVRQDVVYCRYQGEKIEKLHDILIKEKDCKVLIFEDTKRAVERLGRELHARGFRVDELHGDKTQAQRARALQRFKADQVDILVATDVAARGLDIDGITHVINFSVPNCYDDYVHRVGRAGRAGRTGVALTFLVK
jgi:superfamily II DNA/RNA helicase